MFLSDMASKVVQSHFITFIIGIIILGRRGINLFVKNTAYKLIDKNDKTWLKIKQSKLIA